MNEQAMKSFIVDAKEKANAVLAQDHVGADVKIALKDLMQVCDSLQGVIAEMNNSSADSRLAKKKLEQARGETRAAEKQGEELRKVIMNLVNDIKAISGEANAILKRHPDDVDGVSSKQILANAQSMVKVIVATSASKAISGAS